MVNFFIHLNQKLSALNIAVTSRCGRSYQGDDGAAGFRFNRCQIDYSKTFPKLNIDRRQKEIPDEKLTHRTYNLTFSRSHFKEGSSDGISSNRKKMQIMLEYSQFCLVHSFESEKNTKLRYFNAAFYPMNSREFELIDRMYSHISCNVTIHIHSLNFVGNCAPRKKEIRTKGFALSAHKKSVSFFRMGFLVLPVYFK